MKCLICYKNNAIINYPYECFESGNFGILGQGDYPIALCKPCNTKFVNCHIGLLTDKYVESVLARNYIHDANKAMILVDNNFRLDIYHLFARFRVLTNIKSN